MASYEGVERPKIWEDNKRLQDVFYLYNMDYDRISIISFVTHTSMPYLQKLLKSRLVSLFVQDC